MDLEHDRCWRTDGKKWRCGKIVVPNHKYCDRHMYRGRQGSRKQVERNDQRASEPARRISTDNRMPNSYSVATEHRDGIICVSAQNNLGQSHTDRKRGNHQVDRGKECSFENADPRKIKHHTAEKVNQPRFIYPGFGSSPKSVLYCGAGKVELSLGPKNVVESTIPHRCRRTDGKKWQCSRDALPSQKYCQSHMHRGAKRVSVDPQCAITFPGPSAWKGHPSSTLSRSLDNSINLNDIPKSPQHASDNNSTSSTSDATTITDENISFSLAQSLKNC